MVQYLIILFIFLHYANVMGFPMAHVNQHFSHVLMFLSISDQYLQKNYKF
jgi:hypothetical protein